MSKTMAEVLAEHSIHWALTADPDYDERMPHIGKHVPECRTCGPIDAAISQPSHQAEMLEAEGYALESCCCGVCGL